jgi:hypothetical protein
MFEAQSVSLHRTSLSKALLKRRPPDGVAVLLLEHLSGSINGTSISSMERSPLEVKIGGPGRSRPTGIWERTGDGVIAAPGATGDGR